MIPRPLHPGAWWLWALALAVAASRTTNPLLLGLIVAVAAYVVAARRPAAPWGRSFGFFLKLGVAVIAIRMTFQVLAGVTIGTTVVLELPSVPLPAFLSGIRLGGPITAESLLLGFYEGLRLATILACVGAANSLASPARLLKAVPAALYEVGVSVVVALTFAPQLVIDLQRVRAARRLRGRPVRGLRGIAGSALPVLEGALDRSVTLAAAMDSRGYGRGRVTSRRTAAGMLLAGLVAGLIGLYGLLDAATPALLGLPLVVGGLVCAVAGLALAGRRTPRTRYRPDPWRWPEWAVSASGAIAVIGVTAAAIRGVPGMVPPVDPASWPALPLLPALAILIAALPAWLAPPLPAPRATPREPATVAA